MVGETAMVGAAFVPHDDVVGLVVPAHLDVGVVDKEVVVTDLKLCASQPVWLIKTHTTNEKNKVNASKPILLGSLSNQYVPGN